MHKKLRCMLLMVFIGFCDAGYNISKAESESNPETRCEGINIAWSKQVVGADLAEEVVKKVLSSKPAGDRSKFMAKLGVVDNRVVWADVLPQMLDVGSLKINGEANDRTNRGYPIAIDHHALHVASVIAGRQIGVTSQVHLSMYEQELSMSPTISILQQACEENDILNFSGGTLYSEATGGRVSELSKVFQNSRTACVVFISAGNGGYRNNTKPNRAFASAVVQSAFTTPWHRESLNATIGDLLAPGDDIYVPDLRFHSRFDTQSRETDPNGGLKCSSNQGRFYLQSGSSLSSPLNSAVGSQVVTILKARGQWPRSAWRRQTLLRAIMAASQLWSENLGLPTMINALVAVRWAEILDVNNTPLDPQALLAAGKRIQWDDCRENGKDDGHPAIVTTSGIHGSMAMDTHINRLRRRLLLCPQMSVIEMRELSQFYQTTNNPELYYQVLIRRQNQGDPEALPLMREMLLARIDDRKVNIPMWDARRVLNLYAEAIGRGFREVLQGDRLIALLTSGDLKDLMEAARPAPMGLLLTNLFNVALNKNKFDPREVIAQWIADHTIEQRQFMVGLLTDSNLAFRTRFILAYILDAPGYFKTENERINFQRARQTFLIDVFSDHEVAHRLRTNTALWHYFIIGNRDSTTPSLSDRVITAHNSEAMQKILSHPEAQGTSDLLIETFRQSPLLQNANELKKALAHRILSVAPPNAYPEEVMGYAVVYLIESKDKASVQLAQQNMLARHWKDPFFWVNLATERNANFPSSSSFLNQYFTTQVAFFRERPNNYEHFFLNVYSLLGLAALLNREQHAQTANPRCVQLDQAISRHLLNIAHHLESTSTEQTLRTLLLREVAALKFSSSDSGHIPGACPIPNTQADYQQRLAPYVRDLQ